MGDFIFDKKFIFEISIDPFGILTLPILLNLALSKLRSWFLLISYLHALSLQIYDLILQ